MAPDHLIHRPVEPVLTDIVKETNLIGKFNTGTDGRYCNDSSCIYIEQEGRGVYLVRYPNLFPQEHKEIKDFLVHVPEKEILEAVKWRVGNRHPHIDLSMGIVRSGIIGYFEEQQIPYTTIPKHILRSPYHS